MSEIDIVAEIRAYALEGCPTTDTFNEWADHMERLQVEFDDAVSDLLDFHRSDEFLRDHVKRLRAKGTKAQHLLDMTEDLLDKLDYNPSVDDLLDAIKAHRLGDTL